MNPAENIQVVINNGVSYIQIILTVSAAIIASYLAHFFAQRRERANAEQTSELLRIQEYNKAAATFRFEFTETLFNLNHIDKISASANQLLSKLLPRSEKAKIHFIPYLSGSELENLNAAWNKLSSTVKDSSDNVCELAIQRIENLLECANPK